MLKKALVAVGAIAIVGCGGGDPLSEGDAQIAWEATSAAMGGAGASPGAISSAVPCADGGNVKWKYDLLSGFGASSTGVDIEYTLVFKGCKTDGVKIGGRMTYIISSNSSATGSSVEWDYSGNLRYSGNIKGSCEYDMHGRVAADSNGAEVSWEGSICGNDAGATLSTNRSGTTIETTGTNGATI